MVAIIFNFLKSSVSQSLLQNSRIVNGDNCKVNKIYEYSVYEHTRSLCHTHSVVHCLHHLQGLHRFLISEAKCCRSKVSLISVLASVVHS